MADRFYNSEEGEFIDFATMEDWRKRDLEKDAEIKRLRHALKVHEEWEAAIILDGDWGNALPVFTQKIYDDLIDRVQPTRNAALQGTASPAQENGEAGA